MKTFEQYLEEQCPSSVHTNNSPEGFENWLETQDVNDIIKYADSYGKEISSKVSNTITKEIQTWAVESIGWRAVKSVSLALQENKLIV